jgi:hypothetical protein
MFKNLFLNLFGSKHQKRLYEYKLRKASQKPVEYPEPTEEEMTVYNGIVELFKQYPPSDNSWLNTGSIITNLKLGIRLTIKYGEIWLVRHVPHPKLANDLYLYYKNYLENHEKMKKQKEKDDVLERLLKITTESITS